MKGKIAVVLSVMFLFAAATVSAEQAPQKVVDMGKTKLAGFGTDPVIVTAVKGANGKGQTLDQIKAMDTKWRDTPGIADYMQALMDNDCAKHLRQFQNENGFIAEIFVMDNQGANVAMTDKTSDYWQGDEGKFKNSFAGGKGQVFVDEVEFDDSTQAYLVQVSVPVLDGGQAIGAITFGVDVDQVE